MRNGRAKRLFLIALAACFALLVVLFARRSVNDQMAIEREYPRQNMALSLRTEQGGVIRIEGVGKLFADDLKAMLKSAGIHSSSVRDIVVGDGITEIGYKAFNRMRYLKTLKLGGGVARVAPGALKYCASLDWLYLPSGLVEIGDGFLYGCDRCRVVTDGPADALPALDNVGDPGRVIADVDSLKALRAAVGDGSKLPDALEHWW